MQFPISPSSRFRVASARAHPAGGLGYPPIPGLRALCASAIPPRFGLRAALIALALAAAAPAAIAEPLDLPPIQFDVPRDAPLKLDHLRVCSDPNNMPFSNREEQGFENRIAEVVAKALGVPLEYEWRPQRRGFIREGLNAGRCNLVMGEPTGIGMVSTTRPYYRSTYVFLSRRDDDPGIKSLDDPALHELRVGVHLIGNDYTNTPPAHALGKRGIHAIGFSLFGDYARPNPPARLVKAVADGTIDLAVVWGPLAGYFAGKEDVPMVIRPVKPPFDPPAQTFVYSISMAVRSGNYPLRKRLNEVIRNHKAEIDRILAEYHVPLAGRGTGGG